MVKKSFKKQLDVLITDLEKDTLISEAINDVIIIARLNTNEKAFELIKNQFLVINNQDLELD